MSATKDLAGLAARFDADRRHLRSVAFQLLGSVADADDAVQSAWLKASRADFDAVENLTGWFTTITAREAFDQLRARRRRAEQPLAGPDELDRLAQTASAPADEDALLTESVSSALLVVLDRLSPPQRVAFVLHDVFAMPFDQIAAVMHRSPDAAKKLASRARDRVHAQPAAPARRTAQHLKVVEAFLTASRGGDIAGLLELLAPEVVRTVDPALVPANVPTTLRGAPEVATETRRFARRARAGAVMLIDGAPGIVLAARGHAEVLLVIGIGADGRIHTIDITNDAERIRRTALTLPRWPIQKHHDLIGYQGRQTQVTGKPATGQDWESHAR
ncbi:sigma-70 family RNA polymerase sigma factor [Mycobacterium sp. 1165178.9]|uniref:sigma-70 family RNA polymerase sigma factor n=1 Tax=Mycobacterium sp. 1165178.9 TaxID=1834070 RepID=UPI0007FC0436|nr:sigma-70 family RNA polymerase sigma factor [Mycobacterium sp. 1165178.9]OBK81058.1 RNA polymerase subunit sigma [Mycobacterium sp. 1165178.9]